MSEKKSPIRFTLSQVSVIVGIAAHTIRIWEERYPFVAPERNTWQKRYYGWEEVLAIYNVAILNQQGVKISVILKKGKADILALVNTSENASTKQHRFIRDMMGLLIAGKTTEAANLVEVKMKESGEYVLVSRYLGPFLDKFVLVHRDDAALAFLRHYLTMVFRPVLTLCVDRLGSERTKPMVIYLFSLPEIHLEVEQVYLQYVLTRMGFRVLWIRQGLSTQELGKIIKSFSVHQPSVLCTPVFRNSPLYKYISFFRRLAADTGGVPVVVSGHVSYKGILPPGVQVCTSLKETVHVLQQLSDSSD